MTSTVADEVAFRFLGTEMKLKASGASTGGALGLIEQRAPGGFAAPPHIHHGEDEAFYVLEGSVAFHFGEAVIEAGRGAFVWLLRNVAHWFEVAAGEPARLLQFNTPAGLEQFFIEMGTPPGEPDVIEPDMRRLLALAQKYRLELLPPAE